MAKGDSERSSAHVVVKTRTKYQWVTQYLSAVMARRTFISSCHGSSVTWRLVVLFAAWLVGCGEQPPDSARFDVSGIQRHASCLEQAFPLEPSTFDRRRRIDSTGLVMSSRERLELDADLVYLEVFARDAVRNQLGTSIDVDPDLGPQPTADRTLRVEIRLEESCPDLNASFLVRGEVIFESWSASDDERIRGHFDDASIIEARTGKQVADELSGRWHFRASDRSAFPTFGQDDYHSEVE